MISREVCDEILSEEAKRVGAGFGYSPEQPWSSDWYVFEEDLDWATAASDLQAAFGVDMSRNGFLKKRFVRMPARELKPGYIVSDDSGGADTIVEDVSVLPDGKVEVSLLWGYGDQAGGGKRVLEADQEFSVERLVHPHHDNSEGPTAGGSKPTELDGRIEEHLFEEENADITGGFFSEEYKREVQDSLDSLSGLAKRITERQEIINQDDAEKTGTDQSSARFKWDDVGEAPVDQVPTEFPEFDQDGIKTPGVAALADLPDGAFATDADGKLYRKMGAGSVQGSAVIEDPDGDLWQQDAGTILQPSTLRRRPTIMQDGEEIPSKATTYAERVAELENEDMTTSDAQGIADGEGWADDPMADDRRARAKEREQERALQRHIDWMDDNYTPEEIPEEVLEEMEEREMYEDASGRAQDDADDQGIDWSGLSDIEKKRRIEEAVETISEEKLEAAERQADTWGQGYNGSLGIARLPTLKNPCRRAGSLLSAPI
jgi:hypothetical protein